MKRRDFVALIGGAAGLSVMPLVAGAEEPATRVLGFMSARSPEDSARELAAFRKGLEQNGLTEGRNLKVEYRWDASAEQVQEADDLAGHKVLTAYAPVTPLGWFVFVETPAAEAYAPLYTSIQRTWLVLLGALLLAFVAGMALAGRMVVPIQSLRAGAARIGRGDLSQRIAIKTGDEIEALADQFNDMAGRLQES